MHVYRLTHTQTPPPPPKVHQGSQALGYCGVLGGGVFLSASYPLYTQQSHGIADAVLGQAAHGLRWPNAAGKQGYLAHKKVPPPRTLQQDYAKGPTGAYGGGAVFLSDH
jgi:hypothetical protein